MYKSESGVITNSSRRYAGVNDPGAPEKIDRLTLKGISGVFWDLGGIHCSYDLQNSKTIL